MRHDLPPEAMRDWIVDRLDPLELTGASAAAPRSDYDLSGGRPPAGAAPLKPAAVLFGLVDRPSGPSVIFTRRADTLRSHTGQVALPGGRVDPGETPWQTALREAEEEIGLDPSLVTLAGLSTPYQTGTGYLITPVVGFVATPISLSPNPHEVADIFEAPLTFLMNLDNYQQQESRMPNGELRRFYSMNWADQRIWGATAGMVRALRDRLFGAALG